MPSMEIRVHSRLFLPRYNGCTNARWILSRSYGHEEFKNVNPFSAQKAHKAVRACQYPRPLRSRREQSMEIRVYSRLILARYKGCTNARCILSRSYGHEEFKNVNPFSVQKAHKAFRTCQYLHPLHRRMVQSMEIRVYSRLILSRYKVALMQGAYYQEAMGMNSLKMYTLSQCKRRAKLYVPANISVPCSAV